jgi:Protein of unknown function (DUF1553)/Protein of unknown function (DUF1549)/Planctomycete cytochrome C
MHSVRTVLSILISLICANGNAQDESTVDFVRDVRPIFEKHCYECHSQKKEESGFRLDVKAAALKGGDNHGPDIVAGNAESSPLVELLESDDSSSVMPPSGKLPAEKIEMIRRWIDAGAPWPDGIDSATLEDRRDHWSFKPLAQSFPVDSIDQFIDLKLQQNGLVKSPAAEPHEWLRRVTLDLTGLPPTPEEATAFLSQPQLNYEAVVDRLLASPRYGERWAQHWLDVVRYADTHGFEVNTERPNAWHYRDYVIRALNQDTPYDQFVRQQICGDALDEDVATGFLITASVLLPGQIGKDEASVRLARQDAIDEMVNNVGQTFLALSIGCARCHDHKFDPITARDYYAMQAFLAGVEYEEREIRSAEAEARKLAAQPLRLELTTVNERLLNLAPIARPNSKLTPTSPKENVEQFTAINAKYVRFTILAANEHPQLGLIEPCIDEFEIYGEAPEENLALATRGAKVTASGSRSSESHQLQFVNDGQPGNARSWMSDEAGAGWLLFELPETAPISKVIWSRDRLGEFTDRLATAYRLEAGTDPQNLSVVAEVNPLRPTVGAGRVTVDRFKKIMTSKLRFTILATNSLEPCLDELEVFNSEGLNVALATRRTKASHSGSKIAPGRHEPQYVNDGLYGNSRSWMSSEAGKGWVELEFASPQEVSRVLWSRDREGLYEDRLPIEYRIEVELDGKWQTAADSTDRNPHIAGVPRGPEFTVAGLNADESRQARQLLERKRQLENEVKAAEVGKMAFAGKFRKPDEIHLLNRGDPEQPGDLVGPAAIQSLSNLSLPDDTGEQQRRIALADWIASPDNPLTARVIVNRVWQGHFGIGLVETPSDFGRGGQAPSHPELLDWLATRFIQQGWSLKQLHRMIVLSETYRQSSRAPRELSQVASRLDSQSRLLWHFPTRRLDAEVLRDSMLQVSGLLDTKMYGPGFNLFNQRGGLSGFQPVEKLTDENRRRMIYAHKVRREREAVFGAFDCPDAGQSTGRRRESTTPIQALNLLNSPFTIQSAQALAERAQAEAGSNLQDQISRVYQLAFGRSPNADELKSLLPEVTEHGLKILCRAVLNSNEFLSQP